MTEERESAMLTKTQRNFLTGDKTYTGDAARQQRYQRRQAIKKRVRNTMFDFKLLFETWDERGSGELLGENPASGEMGEGIRALLALLYSETYEYGRFETLLSGGVSKGEKRVHPDDSDVIRVDFDVDRVTRVDVQDALDQYSQSDGASEMSKAELATIADILKEAKGNEAVEEVADAWDTIRARMGDFAEDTDE